MLTLLARLCSSTSARSGGPELGRPPWPNPGSATVTRNIVFQEVLWLSMYTLSRPMRSLCPRTFCAKHGLATSFSLRTVCDRTGPIFWLNSCFVIVTLNIKHWWKHCSYEDAEWFHTKCWPVEFCCYQPQLISFLNNTCNNFQIWKCKCTNLLHCNRVDQLHRNSDCILQTSELGITAPISFQFICHHKTIHAKRWIAWKILYVIWNGAISDWLDRHLAFWRSLKSSLFER